MEWSDKLDYRNKIYKEYFGTISDSKVRQGFCPKCNVRLVWKQSSFGRLEEFTCQNCNNKIERTTYYMIKYPTVYLRFPRFQERKNWKTQSGKEAIYVCPEKNCEYKDRNYNIVCKHQIQTHKKINILSPYYKGDIDENDY